MIARSEEPGSVHLREQAFHDELAATMAPRSMPPSRDIQFDDMLLDVVGDVSGRELLDLGCGAGDISLKLLERGANVTGLDVSERLVEVAHARAEAFLPGASASFLAAPAEDTGLPSASFDLVVGKWILHHVQLGPALDEIHRLLRPGGRGIFFENQLTNPILAFSRRQLVGRFGVRRIGTEDEHPFLAPDYELFRTRFDEVELLYPDFCFFELFDRQIFDFRYARLTKALRAIDRALWRRLPSVRRFSFHAIVTVVKSAR